VTGASDLLIACAALSGWEYRHHEKYRLDFFERGEELIAVAYDKRGGIRMASRGKRYQGSIGERVGARDTNKQETVLGWFS
jgi:hypothetical protein